jgi:predicted nucleic acid-binding protein
LIVVDTNLLIYFYIQGEHSDLAEKAFLKDPEWIAPVLWRSEFLSVLAVGIKKGILKFEVAAEIMGEAERLMESREYSVSPIAILRLCSRSRCSSYDCEYVSLAQELNIPLVTMDGEILAQFPETAVRLDAFVR